MSDIEERLRLLAAWRKPGGPTPKEKQPNTYRTVVEAADEIARLKAEIADMKAARDMQRASVNTSALSTPSKGVG